MTASDDRRYRISEVSELVGVPAHVLRQWEERFPPLNPKRNRTGQRVYSSQDVAIAQRIRELLRDEKMTGDGAAKVLAQELRGEGRPRTKREALALLDAIESEIRGLLDRLDAYEEDR